MTVIIQEYMDDKHVSIKLNTKFENRELVLTNDELDTLLCIINDYKEMRGS